MKKTVLTVTAICLATLLLCGAACFGTVNYVQRQTAALTASESARLTACETAAEETYTAALLAAGTTQAAPEKVLSAADIYELACKQVVGISTTVTGYNMFGQLTSNAVTGTGFILSEDGYILTNNHVVEDAVSTGSTVTVKLHDGSEYPAAIVGTEGRTNDIAVLKIDAKGLSPVTLGDSDTMQVGENVFVVGNPLGELTYTMTSGIISALDREIATDRNVNVNMFQLDAAVNAGNSGGPVYDAYGRVLGIVTAKYQSTGIEGLGFAIPINDAVAIARELIDHGYVTGKAYFGIVVTNMSEADAQRYNSKAGVYVTSVNEGSCAEKAGMQQGDVILELGGKAVANTSELASVKKDYKAGDSCEVTVWRSGNTMKLTVTFDEEPAQVEDVPAEGQEEPRQNPGDEWSYGGGDNWGSMWDSFFGRFFDYYGGWEDPGQDDSDDGSSGSYHHFGS